MPNPCVTLNAMTLAAQILALGTVRAGGWVRALLYSCSLVMHWEWCRSEVELSRFLMHYLGSGTSFPFKILDGSVSQCGEDQPIRVVISDHDFDTNFQEDAHNPEILRQAVRVSPHFILLLHRPPPECVRRYQAGGAMVVEVHEMDDFPRMARDLTLALFPEGPRNDL
jgi:hypothetical protein